MVQVMSALLDGAHRQAPQQKPTTSTISTEPQPNTATQSLDSKQQNISKFHQPDGTEFWAAYDVVDVEDHLGLWLDGITLAQELQEAIISQAGSIIEKNHVVQSGSFLYAILTEDNCPKLMSFTNPNILTRLAHLLVDILIVRLWLPLYALN